MYLKDKITFIIKMEFTYNNYSYFVDYKPGESEKVFFDKNLLIVKALDKHRELDLERAQILANIYINHKYLNTKYSSSVFKESVKIFKPLDV